MKHLHQSDTRRMPTMKRSRTAALAAATLSVALIPTGTGMAAATASPSPWETVHEVYDPPLVIEDFCNVQGLTVVASGSIDYRHRSTTRGAEGLSYYGEHVTSFVDTFTNQATGAFITNTGHYTFSDIRVIDNGNGTLTVVSQYAVDTRLRDDAGHLLAHDTGIYRYVSTVDHNGTPSDPADDTVLESSDLMDTGLDPAHCPVFLAALT